jgi:hypothetical protein
LLNLVVKLSDDRLTDPVLERCFHRVHPAFVESVNDRVQDMAQMLLVLAELFPLFHPAMGFDKVKPGESICETLLPLILQSFGKLFHHQLLQLLVLHAFAK